MTRVISMTCNAFADRFSGLRPGGTFVYFTAPRGRTLAGLCEGEPPRDSPCRDLKTLAWDLYAERGLAELFQKRRDDGAMDYIVYRRHRVQPPIKKRKVR